MKYMDSIFLSLKTTYNQFFYFKCTELLLKKKLKKEKNETSHSKYVLACGVRMSGFHLQVEH